MVRNRKWAEEVLDQLMEAGELLITLCSSAYPLQ